MRVLIGLTVTGKLRAPDERLVNNYCVVGVCSESRLSFYAASNTGLRPV